MRKDATVTLGEKLLEVNLSLRALTVELRYDPVLFDRVEVTHLDTTAVLRGVMVLTGSPVGGKSTLLKT